MQIENCELSGKQQRKMSGIQKILYKNWINFSVHNNSLEIRSTENASAAS